MESLLTSVKTTSGNQSKEDFISAQKPCESLERKDGPVTSPEEVRDILKSKPDLKLLTKALRWLVQRIDESSDFNIRIASPKSAQVIHTLVNDVVLVYWQNLNGEEASSQAKCRKSLVSCLRSVAGIGAIVSLLRLLLGELKSSQHQSINSKYQPIEELLSFLSSVLEGDQCIESLWKDINAYTKVSSQRSLQWKELLSLIASGKVLAIAGEASLALRDSDSSIQNESWVGNGSLYAQWLGSNVQYMIHNVQRHNIEGQISISKLMSKALNLGYKDQITKAAFRDLLDGKKDQLGDYQALASRLSTNEQRTLLYALIEVLSREKLSFGSSGAKAKNNDEVKVLRAVSALVAAIVDDSSNLQAGLVDWLVGLSAVAPAHSHDTHRAIIAVLAKSKEQIRETLHKCLELIGDKLYIKHTPILNQEVTTQILLILTGYCFRAEKSTLCDIAGSSIYLSAISNRIAASSPRARFLGMVIGTAVSELVDPIDRRMKFGAEDLSSPDGLWYRNLPTINDTVGNIDDLKASSSSMRSLAVKPKKCAQSGTASAKPPISAKSASKTISIEEIHDGSGSEDEDLPMYEKPDSDPSDEDEDPTLVQRDKPTAPVYIRDLIAGLRDTENYDRHRLALVNAASLIRRKAAFGTEVSDNIEELATLLVGLSDKWEMDDFPELRLQGMIAVLTADPLQMGQWFSKTFYNGDYSMGQRASVLTTLGIGARELAGLGKEDAALTGAQEIETAFPSKRLPDKLHKIYALEAAPMNALSSQLERAMIQPMAAAAADQVTGPNALKVRTFSSRMAVEMKRQKPIPNALAKVVAEGFFFPLTGRWRIHLQSYGETSTHTSPFLLSHLLKTLALILHASGSSTLSLPQMTSEFWDLLLSLRSRATDPSVLEALLFAFLTLLDINGSDQRRLAEEHAKELLETQNWVENVFERVGGGSEEGDRIRMLAAGVLMRTREVVEKFQRMLMGDMLGYM